MLLLTLLLGFQYFVYLGVPPTSGRNSCHGAFELLAFIQRI